LKIICFLFLVLVPVKNGKEDNTNTFLSSSLQKSPTKEEISVIQETNASKESINQTVSTIVPDEELSQIEQNKPTILDETEKKEEQQQQPQNEITPSTSSSALNPDATPFVGTSTPKIEGTQSISSGDESDDEKETSETPATTGK
jgi:hypothetical protein